MLLLLLLSRQGRYLHPAVLLLSGHTSTYRLPEHRNAVGFGTERRRVTGGGGGESELIAVFIGRSSLICICRSTRATYGRTDNLYSKRLVLNNEQQSACRQVSDWLRGVRTTAEGARSMPGLSRQGRLDRSANHFSHGFIAAAHVDLPDDHRVESFHARRSADG